MTEMSQNWSVTPVSQICEFTQNHEIVDLGWMNFMACKLYLSKALNAAGHSEFSVETVLDGSQPASACTFLGLSFSVCEKREGFPDTPAPAILGLVQLRTLFPAHGPQGQRRPWDAGGGVGGRLLGPPPPKLLLTWLRLRVPHARCARVTTARCCLYLSLFSASTSLGASVCQAQGRVDGPRAVPAAVSLNASVIMKLQWSHSKLACGFVLGLAISGHY